MINIFNIRKPDFSKHQEKCGGHYPCVICGRAVKNALMKSVRLHNGGSHIVTEVEASQLDEYGDMGLYPIGNDCLRNHPEITPEYIVMPQTCATHKRRPAAYCFNYLSSGEQATRYYCEECGKENGYKVFGQELTKIN